MNADVFGRPISSKPSQFSETIFPTLTTFRNATSIIPQHGAHLIANLALAIFPTAVQGFSPIFRGLNKFDAELIQPSKKVELKQCPPTTYTDYTPLYRTIILGYHPALTWASLLSFPFLNCSSLYIAQKSSHTGNWEFVKLSLDTVNPLYHPAHRRTLTTLKTLHYAKKYILGNSFSIKYAKTFSSIVERVSFSLPPLPFRIATDVLKICTGLFLYLETNVLRSYALQGHLSDFDDVMYQETTSEECVNFDNIEIFKTLPAELIQSIIEQLDRKTCAQLAGTCRYFRDLQVVFERDKKYVANHYPPAMLEAIGWEKLARFPIVELNARWINPGKVPSAEDWQKIYAECCRQDHREIKTRGKLEHLSHTRLLFFDKPGRGYAIRGGFHLPCIKRYNQTHTLIYKIEIEELQKQPIVRFKDPAGRHGIAFKIDCQHMAVDAPRGKNAISQGVAILHQLDQNNSEGIWVLNLNLPVDYGSVNFQKGNYDFVMTEENLYQWFVFSHQVNGKPAPYCATYLDWLKRLMDGKVCGTLEAGEEHFENRAPTFRLSRPLEASFTTQAAESIRHILNPNALPKIAEPCKPLRRKDLP